MRYGWVARWYCSLERVSFGRRLEKVRGYYLGRVVSDLSPGSDVLLVGDGDGRFLSSLLAAGGDFRIHSVDASADFVRLARERVGDDSGRVEWFVEDFRSWDRGGYDAVFCHFFLDGFREGELGEVIGRLEASLREGGRLVVSDFNPEVGWWGRLLVWAMQLFFLVVAGVRWVRLTDLRELLRGKGFHLEDERCWWGGFLYTRMLQKR